MVTTRRGIGRREFLELAGYKIDGANAELFFCDAGSGAAAADAIARLRVHHEKRGTIIPADRPPRDPGLRFSEPRLGTGTIIALDRFLAGVHGGMPSRAQDRLLVRLLENLDRR